jgi:hypothetical protein
MKKSGFFEEKIVFKHLKLCFKLPLHMVTDASKAIAKAIKKELRYKIVDGLLKEPFEIFNGKFKENFTDRLSII